MNFGNLKTKCHAKGRGGAGDPNCVSFTEISLFLGVFERDRYLHCLNI